MGVDDGINAARASLAHCEFDAAACSEGLKALRSYRKEWDEERGRVAGQAAPRLGVSHGADAFRCLASRYRQFEAPPPKAHRMRRRDIAMRSWRASNLFRGLQHSDTGPKRRPSASGWRYENCDGC